MIIVTDRIVFLEQVKELIVDRPICIEIGVLRGDFASEMFSILDPKILHLIDPFERGDITYNKGLGFVPVAYSTIEDYRYVRERFLYKSGSVFIEKSYSHDAVSNHPDNVADFIYHDASHLYENLKRDLNEWLPKLKKDGILAGHDYIEHESFGVIQAVDEFCKEYNFEMIIYNENGGDYALKRK